MPACSRHWIALAGVGLCLLLAACGGPASAPATPPPAVTTTSVPAQGWLPGAVQRVADAMRTAYDAGDWSGVSAQFIHHADAKGTIDDMQRWKTDQVNDLHTTVVYAGRVGREYIGTIEFYQDAAAVPQYSIFSFAGNKRSGLRISGVTSGLLGASYHTVNWLVSRTAHFTVYHSPYQLRGADRQYLALLERARTTFEHRFGVKVATHISYYLYPLQSMMAPLTGQACGTQPENVGCANPYTRPPSLQASIWPTFHEPIHVYELALEPPLNPDGSGLVAPKFISEGTAVALEDAEVDPRYSDYCSDLRYVPLDFCAQQALANQDPFGVLGDKGFDHASAGDAYSLGGSFVKYLILRFGYRRFGAFYYALARQPKDRLSDYDVATRAVYHVPAHQLITEWTRSVCRNGCT